MMSFIVRHKELLPSIENTWEREKVRKRGKMMMRRRRRIGGENQTYHVIVNQSINRQEELREIEFWVPRSDCTLLAARQACIKRRIGEGRRNAIGDVWPWCLGSKCCIPLWVLLECCSGEVCHSSGHHDRSQMGCENQAKSKGRRS